MNRLSPDERLARYGPTTGDRVLQLSRLVQPVGVERDRDILGIGETQDVIDELWVCAVVLVDLEAAGARVEQGLE